MVAEVRQLSDLPRAIHRAAKTALAPPTDAVFLSLPGDILLARGELDFGEPPRVASAIRGDTGAIAAAAELLAKAESPVIIAGDAVPQPDALHELVELAELPGAPVYDEGMASRAMFPSCQARTKPDQLCHFARPALQSYGSAWTTS